MSDDQKRITALGRLIAEQQALINAQRESIEQQERLIEQQSAAISQQNLTIKTLSAELRRRGKTKVLPRLPGLWMGKLGPKKPGPKAKIDPEETLQFRRVILAYQKTRGYRSQEKATNAWFLETFAPKTRKEETRVLRVANIIFKRIGNINSRRK